MSHFFFFLLPEVFKIWCGFYTCSTYPFPPTTMQPRCNHNHNATTATFGSICLSDLATPDLPPSPLTWASQELIPFQVGCRGQHQAMTGCTTSSRHKPLFVFSLQWKSRLAMGSCSDENFKSSWNTPAFLWSIPTTFLFLRLIVPCCFSLFSAQSSS